MPHLPTGTVTFLFTDVEGSTRLLRDMGSDAYALALGGHRRSIRDACTACGGTEVDTQGDAFFFAFETAPAAVGAAEAVIEALKDGPIRVRIGIHTGAPLVSEEGYVGLDVHRAARIAAAGHGGQILISASAAELVGTDRLRDLGVHRFKDLSDPQRVYQIGDAGYPPLNTLYRTNLPAPASEFIGRERELADIGTLLRRLPGRLLTLTGPGGSGKTRLALQSAAEAADAFPDGVWWIPLAHLRDPMLAIPAILEAIGLSGRAPEVLAGRRALILLDNAEHLLPAFSDAITSLRSAVGPTLLVTSRERLGVAGERVWPVPPMRNADSELLFALRARELDPQFSPDDNVAELCQRLDQLPLAIELAAARTPLLSARDLLERLGKRLDLLRGTRDVDPRQKTLRATVEWSHSLLTDIDRRIFRRLSVFVGGFSLDAAGEVCDADVDELQSLLEKSLLLRRSAYTTRYSMLETIRDFAVEQLALSGESDAVAARHAEHFASLGDRLATGAALPESVGLEAEIPNFRVALSRAVAVQGGPLIARLLTGPPLIWDRGPVSEIRGLLGDAVRLGIDDPRLRGRALTELAWMNYRTGDYAASKRAADEAERLARNTADSRLLGHVLNVLACLDCTQSRYQAGQRRSEEALDLFRAIGDGLGVANTVTNLGDIALAAGDPARSAAISEEACALYEVIGETTAGITARLNLAMARIALGRLAEADADVRACLGQLVALSDGYGLPSALQAASAIAIARGDGTRAAQILGAADALRESLDSALEPSASQQHEVLIATLADHHAYRAGWATTPEQAVAIALETD